MKLFRDFFTESDGESFEILAALGALAVAVAIGLQVYVTYNSKSFDIVQFGTGIGALLISVGGGQKLKPKSEDKEKAPE